MTTKGVTDQISELPRWAGLALTKPPSEIVSASGQGLTASKYSKKTRELLAVTRPVAPEG